MQPLQLSPIEQQEFDRLLESLHPEQKDLIPGSVIGPFLLKFGLPQKILAKVCLIHSSIKSFGIAVFIS